jgi:hypothetical protein
MALEFTLEDNLANLLISLSSKTETDITVNWTCDEKLDKLWYSTDNGLNFTESYGSGNEGAVSIYNLNQATIYKIILKGRVLNSQEITYSAVLEIETYNFPFCNYAPDFTIGERLSLLFYNPLKREITVNLIGADGSIISNDTINTTYLTGFIDAVTIDRLYASIPNTPQANYLVKVTCEDNAPITIVGGVYSVNEDECKPTLLEVSYEDTTASTIALTGNNQYLVRNKSVPSFTATGISALKHATISSVKVNLNEVETPLTLSGTTASGLGTVVNSAVSIYANFIVTDSRGITTKKEKLVNIYDWFEPEALITLERKTSNTGSITVDANYALIGGHNTLNINGYIKKTSESEFTSIGSITSDVEKTFSVDENYDYDVKVELIDALNSTTIYYLVLPRYTPLMYFDANKYSVGVNCFPNNNQTLEIKNEDIYSSLFYAGSGNYSFSDKKVYCSGLLRDNAVYFSINLPKSMKNVTPTITALKINACKNSSGYLFSSYTSGGYNVLTSSGLTTTCNKNTDNDLLIKIQSSSSISETNNTQVIVEVDEININF